MTSARADILEYETRFRWAISLIAGATPSKEMVSAWLRFEDEALQQFCIEYGPEWVQGIAVIDAAHAMASQPPERPMGVDEEDWYDADPPKREEVESPEVKPTIVACDILPIGTRVWKNPKTTSKFNPKPFKSGFQVNTVAGVTVNSHTGQPAYIFMEDESVVDCRTCSKAPEDRS